jgi:hypothetical protein
MPYAIVRSLRAIGLEFRWAGASTASWYGRSLGQRTASAFSVRNVLLILISMLSAGLVNAQSRPRLSTARILELLRAGVSAPRLALLINESDCIANPLTSAERDALRAAGATAAILNGLDRLPVCPTVESDGMRRDTSGLPVSFMLVGPGAPADPRNQTWWRQRDADSWIESFDDGAEVVLSTIERVGGAEPGVIVRRSDSRVDVFLPARGHPSPRQVLWRSGPSESWSELGTMWSMPPSAAEAPMRSMWVFLGDDRENLQNVRWWRQLGNTLWVESFPGGGLMTLHQIESIGGSEPGVVLKRVDGGVELFVPASTHPRPLQVLVRRDPSEAWTLFGGLAWTPAKE